MDTDNESVVASVPTLDARAIARIHGRAGVVDWDDMGVSRGVHWPQNNAMLIFLFGCGGILNGAALAKSILLEQFADFLFFSFLCSVIGFVMIFLGSKHRRYRRYEATGFKKRIARFRKTHRDEIAAIDRDTDAFNQTLAGFDGVGHPTDAAMFAECLRQLVRKREEIIERREQLHALLKIDVEAAVAQLNALHAAEQSETRPAVPAVEEDEEAKHRRTVNARIRSLLQLEQGAPHLFAPGPMDQTADLAVFITAAQMREQLETDAAKLGIEVPRPSKKK